MKQETNNKNNNMIENDDYQPVKIDSSACHEEGHEERVKTLYPEAYEKWGQNLKSLKEIEQSIKKTYRTRLMSKLTKALSRYEMLSPDDKIAVAISGGKDSLLLAKLLQALQKYSKVPYKLSFIAMDPGYADQNRELLEFNLAWLGIGATIYRSNIFRVADGINRDNPCYMCARMRRGFLYSRARAEGCNKLALGHHFNDVIETTLLNILWSANYKNMMPKIVARNFDNMELIRPMFLIEESDIIAWRDYSGLKALDCACTITQREEGSQRKQIKELIKSLKKDNPRVEKSIFRSGENVALDAIFGFSLGGVKHSFLEFYNREDAWEFL